MAVPTLTLMRRALWSAVDNWPAFDGCFARKFKLEGRGPLADRDFVPAISDLTSIAMMPAAPPATPWANNQSQRIAYTIDVSVWTSWRSVLEGERIWEEWNRAVWQQGPPGGGGTYLEHEDHAAVDIHSTTQPGTLLIRDADNEPAMILWSWSITMQRAWSPRTETTALESPEPI